MLVISDRVKESSITEGRMREVFSQKAGTEGE